MAETIERKFGDGCKGCFYRRQISGGAKTTACFYAIETDRLRGCPAGEGCIRYKSKSLTVKHRKKDNGASAVCKGNARCKKE